MLKCFAMVFAVGLLCGSASADQVIDIHTPMVDFLTKKRKADPEYFFASDGVHLNAQGHHIMANAILRKWGLNMPKPESADLRKLVTQKERLLHRAWLSEVGHERPGMKAGMPIDEALQKAAAINVRLKQL